MLFKLRLILFHIGLFTTMGLIGCTNNQSPEISDENQKYENPYFSISYPEGWLVKEVYGPQDRSSTSDGFQERVGQFDLLQGPIATIYFLDTHYPQYSFAIGIERTNEMTKNVLNQGAGTEIKTFERTYRDTEFNSFSNNSAPIQLGGASGVKVTCKAANQTGQYESLTSIELTANNYFYLISYQQYNNFSDKAKQRIDDVINSFSLPDQYPKTNELNPNDALSYDYRCSLYDIAGNFNQALMDCNKAIELNPNFPAAYSDRGTIYSQQGDRLQALSDFNKAIELNPNFAEAYLIRGQVYLGLGHLDQALDDLNKSIELDPNNTASYKTRAYIYQQQRNPQLELADYNKIIELAPNETQIYKNRGLLYQRLGNLVESLNDFDKVIELNPNDSEAYSDRSAIYIAQGNLSQAKNDLNKAIELNPNAPSNFMNLGNIYFNLSDLTQALTYFNKAIEIEPNSINAAPVYDWRGVIYLKQGNLVLALSDVNKSIQICPIPISYNIRASIYFNLGNLTQALDDYDKAIDFDLNSLHIPIDQNQYLPDAYYGRAKVYYQLNNYDASWADVHKAQELGFTVAPDFLESLKKNSGRDQ